MVVRGSVLVRGKSGANKIANRTANTWQLKREEDIKKTVILQGPVAQLDRATAF